MTCEHDHDMTSPKENEKPETTAENDVPARRAFFKSLILPVVAALAGGVLASTKAKAGYGRCHAYGCKCFGFLGSSYTCARGGCGHHYDLHY